jgi:hypothetical protein
MKGGGQQKKKVDDFEECEREELARQALAAEAALQAQEAARVAEEAARAAAHQERLRKDAENAANLLRAWHENNNKSSCSILGGRIKNTFQKKNKSKRGNKRIKKNKRYSRKYSSKSSSKSLKK